MLENILKYQQLDMELTKLEKQVLTSEEKQTMNKMINYVKDAQNKSIAYENRANDLIAEYQKVKKDYDANFKLVHDLTAKNAEEMDEETLNDTFNKINKISSDLYMLERKLNMSVNNIKTILKEFEVTKNNVMKARAKHKESKEKYEKLIAEITPKINKIKTEMKKIESSVDEKLFNKYKTLKHDGIFPVFVKINGKLCGGCHMELPSGKLDKLKNDAYIVCEQCGRVIFN